MQLRFTKMHGAGNDFVMLDGVSRRFDLSARQLRQLADRHFGVGADQILVVEPATSNSADFRYRIFNADGSEVEQCGNGARCFVKFVHALGLTNKRTIHVETLGGVIAPTLEEDGDVTVDMGVPMFDPARVPFDNTGLAPRREGRLDLWPLDVDGASVEVGVVSMGNPHAVQIVAAVDAAPVCALGPGIEVHPRFPQRVNAGFMQIMSRAQIRLRVWERGAGETLACGTGACGAVVTGIQRGRLDDDVSVEVRGGRLRIRWAGAGAPVLMSGPAVEVFRGEFTFDNDIP